MKILFVFCEGPHDAHFIGRLLKQSGQYEEFQAALKDYPGPLDKFFTLKFKQQKIDEIRIGGKPDYPLVPVCGLKDKEKDFLVLPISLGGIDQTEKASTLLKEIENDFSADILFRHESKVERISILFLYDSDTRGIQATTELFNERFQDFLGSGVNISPDAWTTSPKGYPLSLFVFTKFDGNTGTLEDSLIELFRNHDKDLVEAAEKFLNEKFEAFTQNEDLGAYEAKKKKGVLTACGQTEKKIAGSALTVIIRDTQLLNNAFNFNDPNAQWTKLLKLINGAFT